MKAEPTRRQVLGGAVAGTSAVLLDGCGSTRWPGELGGADWQRGHLIREGKFPTASGPVEDVGVLIAGGGIAGLATGWRLAEAGFTDFSLLELEDSIGGNARSGRNAVSAYPLGAHYLPVPNREAHALRHMLSQFGMITGEEGGAPVYDPFQLCADLEERLLWRGKWQEGLYPQTALSPDDRSQRDRFTAAMAAFRSATGTDGKPAFALPMALSSSDAGFCALDNRSFAQWLDSESFSSVPLRAYLRYCCRDDYGTEPEQVSAWAGIHYFAGRRGWAARDDGDRELTWPEGNGRLAALMAERIAPHLRTGHSVVRVERDQGGALAQVLDHRTNTVRRIRARAVVLAMPHFVARHIAPRVTGEGGFSYAPWVVANVTVNRLPEGKGAPLAWDNVSSASESLGYVVASHQTSSADDGPTVLTWYLPLSRETPQAARKILMTRSLETWQRIVSDDLLAMNPDLAGAIDRIDVWRWGHAMARPTPGFLSDAIRANAASGKPPVWFAHSDLSGLSLFEEAHYRGVIAAESVLSHLSHPFESIA
jgi:glycine/D-amino acid oxidase-like deaminating enzyme